MNKRSIKLSIMGAVYICLFSIALYNVPPIHERLAWRVENLRVGIRRFFNPPEEVVFTPQEQIAAIVNATLTAYAESSTANTPASIAVTSTPPLIPSLTPTPIPSDMALIGIRHEYQQFNNCAPTNLAMALSYWGWQGTQYDTRPYLRPNFAVDDKNVNPFEMVDYVENYTEYEAVWRVGGNVDLLKRLVAGGFPVIIEKGLQPHGDAWLGHYQTVTGYNDAGNYFLVYDSYEGPPEAYPTSYDVIGQYWRHFNFAYVVIFPPERAAELHSILGPHSDPHQNFQYAAGLASNEASTLSGREQFFAWFNRGANLVHLSDYAGAAQAYDVAFSLYAGLPLAERPWRVLWYQDGAYAAYYHMGRYQDVIQLAETALVNVDKPVLEETFYWRGLAKEALGDHAGAVEDLRLAFSLNPNFGAAGAALERLTSSP